MFNAKSLLGAAKTWSEFDDICERQGSVYNMRNEVIDCCFFEMKSTMSNDTEEGIDGEEKTEIDGAIEPSGHLIPSTQSKISVYNLLPMKFLTANAARVQIGEDVFKMGKQTGLTIGKLASLSVSFQEMSTGEQYESVVEVEWVGDVSRFADHGDCGSLYCVRRDSMFVPIAIHRASSRVTSYGSNFWEALDVLPEGDQAFYFVNPPSFTI